MSRAILGLMDFDGFWWACDRFFGENVARFWRNGTADTLMSIRGSRGRIFKVQAVQAVQRLQEFKGHQ
jgi:hypothetical protein